MINDGIVNTVKSLIIFIRVVVHPFHLPKTEHVDLAVAVLTHHGNDIFQCEVRGSIVPEKRDVLVENLSYGEQRQIEICLALIENPRLLLLDEPTAGLSRAETMAFTSILKKLDSEITILLIEHDMDVAFEFAENISVLQLGALVVSGNKDEIKANKKVQEIYLGTENNDPTN